MIAYFFKTKTGYELTICSAACNGAEFNNAEKIKVSGKREANAICKARKIQPWNF